MLRQFGFADGVEALYLALVDAPALSAAELAALGVLAPAELPAALKNLEADGLIHQLPGQPRRYSAVDPELGLVALVAAQEQAASRARSATRQLTERFRAARRGRDPLDVVDVVVGPDAQRRRFDQLQRLASTELRGFDKPPYLIVTNGTQLDRLGKGVRVRALYDTSALSFPGKQAEIRHLRDAGEQQRLLDGVPLKMVVADELLAVIRLTGTSPAASSCLYVHPSALLEGLCRLFETLWKFAVPLHPDDGRPDAPANGDRPSPEEAAILGLLAAGMTDEAIARHLSLSVRTVRRQLRALMDRLGAHTRFQAGQQAARRGWI